MNSVETLLRATRSRADDLILGLRNQTVSLKSENTVLKNRNVLWIRVNETGHITGRVKRGDALINVVYAPSKGQWYTADSPPKAKVNPQIRTHQRH